MLGSERLTYFIVAVFLTRGRMSNPVEGLTDTIQDKTTASRNTEGPEYNARSMDEYGGPLIKR